MAMKLDSAESGTAGQNQRPLLRYSEMPIPAEVRRAHTTPLISRLTFESRGFSELNAALFDDAQMRPAGAVR